MLSLQSLIGIATVTSMLVPTASFAIEGDVPAEFATTPSSSSIINNEFLRMFFHPTANDGDVTMAFDARAFTSNPCFEAVGTEQDYCLRLYGITSDFSTMVSGNMLGRMMLEYSLKQRCENLTDEEQTSCLSENTRLLPQLLQQVDMEFGSGSTISDTENGVTVDTETTAPALNSYARSQYLWKLCANQALCYQSHLRFVSDTSVTMEEIEKVLSH